MSQARSIATVVAGLMLCSVAPAAASGSTPAFARQTGLACNACHTHYPELTATGRAFKLNGYVFTNVKQLAPIGEQGQRMFALSEIPPVSVQLQGSNTMLAKGVPDSGVTHDLSQKNSTEFPQALSLFYTGKIADELGAFLQLTWNPSSNSVGIDNSDLRFANHAAFGTEEVPDLIYGVTLNNSCVLEQNLGVARGFKPMSEAKMQAVRDRARIFAADGRYELFKSTKKYDGKVGREQHHYPPEQKLPV